MAQLEFLADCLVDGDAAAQVRARRARGVSLAASLGIQAALLAAALVLPLMVNGENPGLALRQPLPPYRTVRLAGSPPKAQPPGAVRPARPIIPGVIYQPTHIPPKLYEGPEEAVPIETGDIPGTISCPTCPNTPSIPGEIPGPADLAPRPPSGPPAKAVPRAPIQVSQPIMMGRLIHRVEPKFPPIARVMGLSGRVELKAIIGRDGRIHSLQVLSGHPAFINAAREAIEQWRYQPTMQGGEAVEVETRITVIFTLNR
jgi:protein TonB